MNNVLFRRGDQTFIDENVPLNDGQIIFNETDEAIYVDTLINNVVTRKRYGGGNLSRSDIDMALSTTSENPVANKVLTELMVQKADVIDDLGTALAVTENGVPTGCKTIQGLNTNINTTQAQVSNSGDSYNPTRDYKVGDLCIYNNVLYRCIAACSAGSWATNQSCFTEDTLVNVGNSINNNTPKIVSRFTLSANSAQNINLGIDGIGTNLITASSNNNAYGAFIAHINNNSIISVYSLSETTPGVTAIINTGNTSLLALTNTSSQTLNVVVTRIA